MMLFVLLFALVPLLVMLNIEFVFSFMRMLVIVSPIVAGFRRSRKAEVQLES